MVSRPAAALGFALSVVLAPAPFVAAQEMKGVTTTGGLVTQVHFVPDPPKSGVPVLTWFMLTRATRGSGSHSNVEPAQCACVMAVFGASGPSSAPLMKPALRSVSANGRPGLIGAKVTFPSAGTYVVQLAGRPAKGGGFTAFRTDFVVAVAAP